jgi:adenylate kinase family enzyme
MKRVAIFGNAGGGKSTLARELAAITGLPLLEAIKHEVSSAQRHAAQQVV